MISSGSIRFLEQIKNRFNLPYKIYVDKRDKEIYGRKIRGTSYCLHVGPELFNKMMKNYTNSMPRKRCFPASGRNHYAELLKLTHLRRFEKEVYHSGNGEQ